MSTPSIAQLRQAAFRELALDALLGCEMGAFGIYLQSLIETDTEAMVPAAAPVYEPWHPNCKCGASSGQACRCMRCAYPGCLALPAAESYVCEKHKRAAVDAAEALDTLAADVAAAPAAVVEVELVAKTPVPPQPAAADPEPAMIAEAAPTAESARCLTCRRLKVRCQCGQTAAAPAVPEDEQAGRIWIMERCASAAASSAADRPRIDVAELMLFTGWDRSRAVKFVTQVLDETRRAGASLGRSIEAGFADLAAAVHGADDDDEEDAEEADAEPPVQAAEEAPARKPAKASKPPRTRQTLDERTEKVRERNAMWAARRKAQERGEVFDEAAWREGYRARKAVAA